MSPACEKGFSHFQGQGVGGRYLLDIFLIFFFLIFTRCSWKFSLSRMTAWAMPGMSLSFVKAYLGHKCSGRNQKNPVPDTTKHLRQDIGGKGGGCTAAAGTACMGVLSLTVIDQDAAVIMAGPQDQCPGP